MHLCKYVQTFMKRLSNLGGNEIDVLKC